MRLQRRLRKLHNSGEISIYLSLVFTVLISMLLTVITSARGAATQVVFECAIESSLLSAFGEYNKKLLEDYDVLFIDMSYLSKSPDPVRLESRLNSYFEDNLHPESDEKLLFISDFIDIKASNVSLTEYELATDNFGRPFAEQAVSYMKSVIGIPEIKRIENLIAVCDEYEIDTESYENKKEDIISSINNEELGNWQETVIKNEYFALLPANPEMDFIMGDSIFKQSHESINLLDTLTFRKKHKGNDNEFKFEFEPLENIYFSEYTLYKLGNYRNQKEDSHLKYEVEYVIWGANTDVANLRMVARFIYAYRAIEDYISLNLASDRVSEAEAAGAIISALTKIPEEVAAQLVLILWAAAEAVTDVRDLFDGEKVPIIKQSSQINISLEGIINKIGSNAIEDKNSIPLVGEDVSIPDISIGYTDYLRLIMYSMPMWVKTYRVMDMIEHDIRKSGNGNEYFRFDSCTGKINAVFSIESGFDFRFVSEKRYSYF